MEESDDSCLQYLEELPVSQRFTHQLLHIASNNKHGGNDAHQQPGEDEREAHTTERAQVKKFKGCKSGCKAP